MSTKMTIKSLNVIWMLVKDKDITSYQLLLI